MIIAAYPAALWLLLAAWLALLPRALVRLRGGPALAAIVLAGLALRLAAGPGPLVYYDEFEHLDIARRLAATGAFAGTLVGGLPGWDVLSRPTWPGGHHAALALFLKLGGGAFLWSALLSSLTAAFVYWAAREAFDDERGALGAACVWVLAPLAVSYGRASDLTSSSLFWIAAALAALHAREKDPALNAFCALTLAYAVNVRPENVLLVGYAALLRAPLVVVLPALAAAAFPAAISLANRADALPGYSAGTTAPLSHLARNFAPNLRFFLERPEFWLMIPPALLAAFTRRPAARLAALSAAFLLLYGCFFRGRFDAGTEDRYALSVALPLAVASNLGGAAVPAALLAAGLSSGGRKAHDAAHEASRLFLQRSAILIPERAFVAAFNPPFVREVARRPAAAALLILEDLPAFEARRAAVGADPRLVLYKDWAWRSRPEAAAELERRLAEGYDASPLAGDGRDSLVLLTPRLRGRR